MRSSRTRAEGREPKDSRITRFRPAAAAVATCRAARAPPPPGVAPRRLRLAASPARVVAVHVADVIIQELHVAALGAGRLASGHFCLFLPKFHPELNFIERYWSRVKWYARQFCDGTIKGLKAQADVAMAMSSETCDLALMRRYSRTAWR